MAALMTLSKESSCGDDDFSDRSQDPEAQYATIILASTHAGSSDGGSLDEDIVEHVDSADQVRRWLNYHSNVWLSAVYLFPAAAKPLLRRSLYRDPHTVGDCNVSSSEHDFLDEELNETCDDEEKEATRQEKAFLLCLSEAEGAALFTMSQQWDWSYPPHVEVAALQEFIIDSWYDINVPQAYFLERQR
jgi:hypothetical protein